jgi:hypothetical protein
MLSIIYLEYAKSNQTKLVLCFLVVLQLYYWITAFTIFKYFKYIYIYYRCTVVFKQRSCCASRISTNLYLDQNKLSTYIPLYTYNDVHIHRLYRPIRNGTVLIICNFWIAHRDISFYPGFWILILLRGDFFNERYSLVLKTLWSSKYYFYIILNQISWISLRSKTKFLIVINLKFFLI